MSNQWYFSRDDEQHGPYTDAELKSLALSGELFADDLVWKEGMIQWKPASGIKDLYFSTRRATKEAVSVPPPMIPNADKRFCRSCGEPGTKNAVACLACGLAPDNGKAFCHACGAPRNPAAIICVKCGIGLGADKSERPDTSPKDPMLMAVLSFCVPPLGQLLIGQKTKALVIFLCAPLVICGLIFASFGVGVFIIPVYPILMAVDAYLLASRIKNGECIGEWEFALIPHSQGIRSNQKNRPAPQRMASPSNETPGRVVELKPSGLAPSLYSMLIITGIAFLWGVFGFFELGPSGLRDVQGFFVCISIAYNGLVGVMLWISASQKLHSTLVMASRMVFANWIPFFLTHNPIGIPLMGCILSVAAALWGQSVLQREDVKEHFASK